MENSKKPEKQSLETFINFLESQNFKGTAQEFTDYCIAEMKKRKDIKDEFDEEVHQSAVKLVLRKLGALETEGMT